MTNPNVQDLLTELAEPIDPPNLAPNAWDEMQRRRTHRRRAVVSGAAASVLVVGGGAAYLRTQEGDSGSTRPAPAVTTDPPRPAPELDGYRAWSAPTLDKEAAAGPIASPLPASIDLAAANPSAQQEPIDRAVAAFGIVKIVGDSTKYDGVMLVTEDGQLRHTAGPGLGTVQSPTGNAFLPFNAGSLSPDGTMLALVQEHGVAVYDLARNSWSTFPLFGDLDLDEPFVWSADSRTVRLGVSMVNVETGTPALIKSDESILDETRLEVQSWWGAERIAGDNHARGAAYLDEPNPPIDGVEIDPPAIVVDGGVKSVLLIPDQMERWKNCCAVAGWLDPRTVAYESRFGEATPGAAGQTIRVLAWDVLDGGVGLVSTITGASDMKFLGSYADLDAS